ncbi:MAG: FAD-binding oxidoreductase [Beijerinckiaceae bacterium]|nr:FAD-binding oxidoreductase [Beijerinckiaceae bacterium]
MTKFDTYDVVIAGGAVTGSSTAYHLASNPDFRGRVLVIEKDPTYSHCATALSAGSIRQQFSSAINILISLHGIRFLRAIGETLEVDGVKPNIGLHENGYLFLATDGGQPILAENHELQTSLGADIAYHDPDALKGKFPWLNTEGIAAGAHGVTGEGWFDGYALMQAFRAKARSLGVEYVTGTAIDIEHDGSKVHAVRLSSGARIACGALVNAAGTGASALAAKAGVALPIASKKRMIFMFDCRETLERFPLLIDPSGVYVRPEGDGYICGSAPPEDADPDSDSFELEHDFFEDVIWPTLAARVPAFETIKMRRGWAGHYDMNLFDHNVFIGRAPSLSNFYLANGFSGHGLQQSPAVGRGLSELIAHGAYRTLDLSPLGYDRYLKNEPLIEKNVV